MKNPKPTQEEISMNMPFADYLIMIGGILKRNKKNALEEKSDVNRPGPSKVF